MGIPARDDRGEDGMTRPIAIIINGKIMAFATHFGIFGYIRVYSGKIMAIAIHLPYE